MDPEVGAGPGNPERRKSSGRRRSTVPHVPQEVVDHAQLSDADRRLAEMGYVQVSPSSLSLPPPWFHPRPFQSTRGMRRGLGRTLYVGYSKAYIANRAPLGLQARVLLAVLLLLRPLHLRPLRLRLHDLHLPSRSRRCLLRRLVLARQWVWLLLHRSLRRRARLRISDVGRFILHLQVPRSGEMGP